MATKPKTTAVAVKASTNVVSIKDALKAQAAAMSGRLTGGTSQEIKYSKGAFVLPDGRRSTDPIQAVILDFVTSHTLYEDDYEDGKISPIICAALGDDPRNMVPYSSIATPHCDTCNGCEFNEYESAKMGRGKMCKQVTKMALLVANNDGSIDPAGPIYTMLTTPKSIKTFSAYAKSVAAVFGMPPISVVTTLALVQDGKNYVVEYHDPIPNEGLADVFPRQAAARAILMEEANVVAPTPKTPKARPAARR